MDASHGEASFLAAFQTVENLEGASFQEEACLERKIDLFVSYL
jgi:hypothetical protein